MEIIPKSGNQMTDELTSPRSSRAFDGFPINRLSIVREKKGRIIPVCHIANIIANENKETHKKRQATSFGGLIKLVNCH